MSEAMCLEKALESIISGKGMCEKCGQHLRDGIRKWCPRCIAQWERLQKGARPMAKMFLEQVGERYTDARLEQIGEGYRKLLCANDDIYIWGVVGVGKTYAIAALIRKYICEGYSCIRINFDAFCCKLRSTMNNNSKETEDGLIKELVDVDKLFIDDVGLNPEETRFAYITFYTILNKRQERRLQTIIASNKSIEQLNHSFDSRITSRLGLAVNIHMEGKDKRVRS